MEQGARSRLGDGAEKSRSRGSALVDDEGLVLVPRQAAVVAVLGATDCLGVRRAGVRHGAVVWSGTVVLSKFALSSIPVADYWYEYMLERNSWSGQ